MFHTPFARYSHHKIKGAVVVATLSSGASAFSCSSPVVGARQSGRMAMAATGQGGRAAGELPTSRKDVLGAVFGAVGVSSFAFVAAADAKVGLCVCAWVGGWVGGSSCAVQELVACLRWCLLWAPPTGEPSQPDGAVS